jgi:hypothetical protein
VKSRKCLESFRTPISSALNAPLPDTIGLPASTDPAADRRFGGVTMNAKESAPPDQSRISRIIGRLRWPICAAMLSILLVWIVSIALRHEQSPLMIATMLIGWAIPAVMMAIELRK